MGRQPRSDHSRVFLHIGEPKTGTTYLQQLLWSNREHLSELGVRVLGARPQSVFRAVQDLRGIVKRTDDPAASWAGEWQRLAREAREQRGVKIVSHELLCAVDEHQARQALASFPDAEVHVVVTVRDMATLLPAEWQESVKHRSTRNWDDWLCDVIDKEAGVVDRNQYWFWRVHDTVRILSDWAQVLPASRIHVVTVPNSARPARPGSDELWRRFSTVLGIDDAAVDTDRVRVNASLGLPEVELLRRLNCALPSDVPDWFYMWNVKEPLAHGVLAERQIDGRLRLPGDRHPWAREHAESVIDGLRTGGYDIVGDLDDLRPPAVDLQGAHPGDVADEQLLDAAVAACAALITREYRRGEPTPASPFVLGEALLALTKASPAVRRLAYGLTERTPWAARVRRGLRDRVETARMTS